MLAGGDRDRFECSERLPEAYLRREVDLNGLDADVLWAGRGHDGRCMCDG